jgi:hypothetical protein
MAFTAREVHDHGEKDELDDGASQGLLRSAADTDGSEEMLGRPVRTQNRRQHGGRRKMMLYGLVAALNVAFATVIAFGIIFIRDSYQYRQLPLTGELNGITPRCTTHHLANSASGLT